MALDDRNLSGEQYLELTCGTENLSPYSSNTGYADPPTFYQTEYDWQHAQSQQHHTLSHHVQLLESGRHCYQGYLDENEGNRHSYSTFGHQATGHSDFYSQGHGLWPNDNHGDAQFHGQLGPHHRFFSGIDLGQQSVLQQASTTTGPNGKPKRKRVQSHSQRKAANVRERRRMFHLNEAFDELRKRLPAFTYEKRLSRIETLRLAMTYISFMKEVSIGRDPKCVKLKPHGADLSPLPRSGSSSNLLASNSAYTGNDNNDDCNVNDDSDCSNDELSNHSGGH